jgi:uncharacterized protein with gpF-like domain
MMLAGIEQQQWLATEDSRTRPDHADADGQVVQIGDVFLVGGEALRYPGGVNASAAQTANCRCTILAVADVRCRVHFRLSCASHLKSGQ